MSPDLCLARASTRYHWASGFRFIRIPLGLAHHEFAMAYGEMARTLEVKRNVVIGKHRDQVEEMYGGESQ